MKTLIIGLMLCGSAVAQNTVVVVQADPYAQSFADTLKKNREQAYETGRALGNLIVPKVTGIVLGIKCGRFSRAVIMYSNGTEKNIESVPQDASTQDHIRMLLSSSPNASTVDLGCQ